MQKPENYLSMKKIFCACKSLVNNFLKRFLLLLHAINYSLIMLLLPFLTFSLSVEVLNYILLMNEY